MKRLIILFFLLLSTLDASAQTGKSIYQKYSGQENVSAVYISSAMFRMIGKIPDLKAGDDEVDLTPIIQKLSGFYIISSVNPSINENLQSEVKRFIANGRYELLMEAIDSGEIMRMYSVGSEKTVNSFVMFAIDGSETTFICLDGQMDRDQLEKVLAEEMKK
ncbi:MAG: DUF4252 domain-containing protein [Bacteroidales bacterium]|nr:DUF4252 domain-containing protein [Bacteroidales bacterium]